MRSLALIGDFAFHRLGEEDAWRYDGIEEHWEASRNFAGVKYLTLPTSTAPYLKAGFDYYIYRWKITSEVPWSNYWYANYGISFGAGIQVKGTRDFGPFIELLYSSIFTGGRPIKHLDLRAGITLFLEPRRRHEPRQPMNVP